jgi:hypothetical protein
MFNAIFRPVEKWVGEETPPSKRKRSRFAAKYGTTLDDLERELEAIKATDVVIQCYLERKDIRNDGWPRSSARPSKPGVIVTFQQGEDSISMPCDTFLDWEQNLRAIALTLHALRMVGQYGVTKHNEQYAGFKRLEAPSKQSEREWAAKFLTDLSGLFVSFANATPETIDAAYKLAARRVHPDAGGSHDEFVRMQKAVRILRGEA